MKALTVSQPFASMIANGSKYVENRTWETKYRGALAIHAGQGTQYMTRRDILEQGLAFGAIVAIGELQACVRLSDAQDGKIELPPWLTTKKFLTHEHTEGPWCWIIGDIHRFTHPIEAKGNRRLWDWHGKVVW